MDNTPPWRDAYDPHDESLDEDAIYHWPDVYKAWKWIRSQCEANTDEALRLSDVSAVEVRNNLLAVMDGRDAGLLASGIALGIQMCRDKEIND